MLTSSRTLSLFVLMLAACSSKENGSPVPDVAGGQSGTDSSGELAERCEAEGEPEAVPMDQVIDEIGRSASDFALALDGAYSVPCIGGDDATCDTLGTLELDIASTGSATVQRGTRRYSEGEEEVSAEPGPCSILRLGVQARARAADGALDVTAATLVTTRSDYAAFAVVGRGTLFGEEEDVRVYVSLVGVEEAPRAIDAVLENERGGRALYAWERSAGGGSGTGSVDGAGGSGS